MLRIVLDTDVVVSGFISPDGASRQLLLDALDRRFSLLLSTSLLTEYEAVMCRPQHLAKAQANEAEVLEILDALAGVCIPVVFDYRWRPSGAHPDDELVLETAINGQADAIATFNLKDIGTAGKQFGFIAQRPGPLLRSMKS
jgi:putative PIN family toxin of toxin-antitoxin system